MGTRPHQDLFDEAFLRRLERLHVIAKRLAARGPSGFRRSRRLGDGLEVADHRNYLPGDDIRFIDWPYYARMEKLLLRLFHEHSEAAVAILLDTSASMAPGGDAAKFDYARRAAAAMAYIAMASLERVTLQPLGEQLGQPLEAGRNRGEILRVLDFLAGLQAGGRTNLLQCCERLSGGRKAAGTVLLLSDLLDVREQLSPALAHLRRAGADVHVLHIYSPAESEPAMDGALELTAAETGRRMAVYADKALLESYRRQWTALAGQCEKTCLSRGASYVAASTGVPMEQLVLGSLRRAGVLAG